MSVALLNTKITEAITAAESGDYSTAVSKLRSAKALLIGMPNASHGGDSMQWDRTAIDSLLREYQSAQEAASLSSTGVRVVKVRYKGASE